MLQILLFYIIINPVQVDTITVQGDNYLSNENVDRIFLQCINQYRMFHGVDTIKWDDQVHKIATHHSKYQVLSQSVGHRETIELKQFKEINTPRERCYYYIDNNRCDVGENARGGDLLVVLDNNTPFAEFVKEIWREDIVKLPPLETMIYYNVWKWNNSPSHRDLLLNGEYTKGAVSIYYTLPKIISSIFHQGNTIQMQGVYATFNVIK